MLFFDAIFRRYLIFRLLAITAQSLSERDHLTHQLLQIGIGNSRDDSVLKRGRWLWRHRGGRRSHPIGRRALLAAEATSTTITGGIDGGGEKKDNVEQLCHGDFDVWYQMNVC